MQLFAGDLEEAGEGVQLAEVAGGVVNPEEEVEFYQLGDCLGVVDHETPQKQFQGPEHEQESLSQEEEVFRF